MDCAAPAIQTPMDRIETIDPEKDGFNETKTYDLKFDSDIYLVTVEINSNEKITFRVFKKKYISYYFYEMDYKYESLIKKLLIPRENYNNLFKIYKYLDECFSSKKISIIHEKEKKILKILVKKISNNKNEINCELILNEAKLVNEDIIKYLIEEKDNTKDLLIKLQILSNGILEEKKKSKNYLEKIKDLEKCLKQKDNEVVSLTKQKYDLQESLTFEKSKRPIKTNNKKIDKIEISQYEEIINEQGYKLRDLNSRLENEKNNFEQQRKQFQILIKDQNLQLMDVKQKYEKVQKENSELIKKEGIIKEMIKRFEDEKIEYAKKFERYQNDKIIVQKQNVELQNDIDKLRKENYEKEKEIIELKKKNEDMGVQLNEMKINLLNKKLTAKSFKAEMIKPKRIIEIIFQYNKEEDKYEMVIKGKNKKDSDENIKLLDIDIFMINDKEKNRVDIEYTVSINYI